MMLVVVRLHWSSVVAFTWAAGGLAWLDPRLPIEMVVGSAELGELEARRGRFYRVKPGDRLLNTGIVLRTK